MSASSHRRISGPALAAMVAAMRTLPGRIATTRFYRKELGIDRLRSLPPGRLPISELPLRARHEHGRPSQQLEPLVSAAEVATSESLRLSLEHQQTTSRQLTERALAAARALAAHSPSLAPLMEFDDARALAAADRSDERRRHRRILGPLDGIPIAIKEEAQMAGFTNRFGSGSIPENPEDTDCPAVQRLREHGAILIGRTPMTEYGVSPLGENVHRTMPRNPHDTRYLAGGSSTGSAVAVATGVVPVALGSDGGGSIRVPAAAVGAFGLKPTFGRTPLIGDAGDNSIVHFGPIGASTIDLARFVAATAGPHPDDPSSLDAPPLSHEDLEAASRRGVAGLRIGVDEALWRTATEEVATPGRQALDALRSEGAILVPIQLRYAAHAAAIGYIVFAIEMFTVIAYARGGDLRNLGLNLQLIGCALGAFEADDYVLAKRLRNALRHELQATLSDVDVIAIPTMARPATLAGPHPQFFDPDAMDATTRFVFVGNLTGLPAGTAPVGMTSGGLPVGLQILGDAWDEAAVLQVMAHLERIGVARLMRSAYYRPLI